MAATLPGAQIVETTDLDGAVEVILGADFTGTVLAPRPIGTPLDPKIAPRSAVVSGTTVAELPADLSFTNAADDTCA